MNVIAWIFRSTIGGWVMRFAFLATVWVVLLLYACSEAYDDGAHNMFVAMTNQYECTAKATSKVVTVVEK